MSAIFILLIVCLGHVRSSQVSVECQKQFMQFKHPYVCCKYPMRKVLPEAEANCKSKCSNGSKNDCCILDCTYRETGVLVNGVFNEQALLKLYENFLDDNGFGKYSPWFPVIEKSIHKCMETMPKAEKIFSCKIPEFVIDIIDCVNLMNYLKCPTFERTEPCEKGRDFIRSLKTCGRERNGTMLISHEYWDFRVVDRNKIL